jgi:Bacteriophage HK97-gp10, putative tail-component
MDVKIDGLSELSEMLTHESVRTAKRYLENVAEPAAQVVLDAMAETCPVGVTGDLKRELTFQTRFSDGDDTTLTVKIGPARETFWGLFQEFGTRNVSGTDKKGRPFHHESQPGQHWMQRAWAACQNKCLSVFGTEALARLADMEEKKK